MTPIRFPRAVSRSATLSCTSMLRPAVRSSRHLACMPMMTTQLGMDSSDVTLTTHTNSVSMAVIGCFPSDAESSVVADGWCSEDDVELSVVSDGWCSEDDVELSLLSGW